MQSEHAAIRPSAQVVVSLLFQLGPEGGLQRLKSALTFDARTSLRHIFMVISGQRGTRPLWPRRFAETRADAAVACFFCFQDGAEEWLPHPPLSQLSHLVAPSGTTPRLQLLLRVCRAGAAAAAELPCFAVAEALACRGAPTCWEAAGDAPHRATAIGADRTDSDTQAFSSAEEELRMTHRAACSAAPPADNLPIPPVLALAAARGQGRRLPSGQARDGLEAAAAAAVAAPSERAPPAGAWCAAVALEDAALYDLSTTEPPYTLGPEEEGEWHGPAGGSPSAPKLAEGAEIPSLLLFRAVLRGSSLEAVRLLLASGADVRATDCKGSSVMHFWARATAGVNQLMLVGEELIRAGADPSAWRQSDGMSPLHHVCARQNHRRGWLSFHKALFLLRHGADPAARTHRGQLPHDMIMTEQSAGPMRSRQSETERLLHLLALARSRDPSAEHVWLGCSASTCSWCHHLFSLYPDCRLRPELSAVSYSLGVA